MSKKKKFTISSDITQGITDSMNAVDNNAGNFRYEVIALSRIEIDPKNPRDLAITPNDILNGLQKDDPNYLIKKTEYDNLNTLSYTIKEQGIINPIVVYRHQEKYRIIAGERRYLASLIVNNDDIHARVINGVPSELDVTILQWVENNEREDLSLYERVVNIKSILNAYRKKKSEGKITIELLHELTGLSKSHAARYLLLINGPEDLLLAIKNNKVTGLKKAAFVAGISDVLTREKLYEMCSTGSDLKSLKNYLHKLEKDENNLKSQKSRRGRPTRYVNLGKTKDTTVVKKIFDIVFENPSYTHLISSFQNVDWDEFDSVSKAFAQLLKKLTN